MIVIASMIDLTQIALALFLLYLVAIIFRFGRPGQLSRRPSPSQAARRTAREG
jgi:hypothetical protein